MIKDQLLVIQIAFMLSLPSSKICYANGLFSDSICYAIRNFINIDNKNDYDEDGGRIT